MILFLDNSAEMSDDAEYRCFVGGLAWSTSDRELREAFDKFGGLIDAKVIVSEYHFSFCSCLSDIVSEYNVYTWFN